MRRRIATAGLLIGLVAGVVTAESPGTDAALAAVNAFGNAMQRGEASLLRPLLPQKGKVQLKLDRLGPEQGSFSASQVEALLRDFLAQGLVRGFQVLRVDDHPHGLALASTRVDLTDKQGRPATVELHLTFQSEGDRWVLRGIRETSK